MGNDPIIKRQIYKQKQGTCFAYATAGVLLSCWQRNNIPHEQTHTSIVQDLIFKFGFDGAVISEVVEYLCEQHHLYWTLVQNPQPYLSTGIPLIATVNLSQDKWQSFLKQKNSIQNPYYWNEQLGKLTKQEEKNGICGHAFTLIDYRTQDKTTYQGNVFVGRRCYTQYFSSYTMKNSWGKVFGNNGYAQLSVTNAKFNSIFHIYSQNDNVFGNKTHKIQYKESKNCIKPQKFIPNY